jgi:hypothetical protein
VAALLVAGCGASGTDRVIQPTAGRPVFSPPGGTFSTAQLVAMASPTPGATIHYTADGSTPTAASPAYDAPVVVSATATLKAIAVASGYLDSEVGEAAFTIVTPAATPAFTPAPGTYAGPQMVSITCDTAGATIHFTTDGSTPTAAAAVYSAPIALAVSTTIRALAVAAGHDDSAVATGVYTILPAAATPVFSPVPGTYFTALAVTISAPTPGAAIYYTTDGSAPTAGSTLYSGPVPIATATTLEAIAVADGFSDSAVATGTFTLVAATPVFTPAPGTYAGAQTVTMSSATPGAAIHYTSDGSAPGSGSPLYAGPVSVSTTTTLKAIAVLAGFGDSSVAAGTFTIDAVAVPAATPSFSPAAGSYGSAVTVGITCSTPGASIHYTLDGSTPTASSTLYASPIALSSSTTLRAIATAPGFTQSAVASADYVINLPQAATPIFSPAPGTYVDAGAPLSVDISSASAGAVIHYTADGSTPTAASPVPAGPVSIPVTTTLKAMAAGGGYSDSAVATGTFTLAVAEPVLSPAGGTYLAGQSVVVTCATPGAVIRYTTDGSTPTLGSPLYSGPIPVAVTTTIRAMAVASAHADSAVASATYTIAPKADPPSFSPPPGVFTATQSVSMASATPGATIHYTTDGSIPTVSSTAYGAPVVVAATTTFRAIAAAPGSSPSDVVSGTYVIAPFAAVCQAVLDAYLRLESACQKANPVYLSSVSARAVPCADLAREIAALRIAYDPAQGAICQAESAALTCSALLPGGAFALPPSCLAALVGQVADGGACYLTEDCRTGYCDSTGATCPGTCRPYAQAGQGCAAAPCAVGLACQGGTCRVPSGPGGPCPCGNGLWCDLSGGQPGVCRLAQTSGACNPAIVGQCDVGYACAEITSACLPLVGQGGSCAEGASRCGAGHACLGNQCIPWAVVDQPCLESPACTAGYCCVGGYCDVDVLLCVPYEAAGAVCDFYYECESGQCVLGACQAPTCAPP